MIIFFFIFRFVYNSRIIYTIVYNIDLTDNVSISYRFVFWCTGSKKCCKHLVEIAQCF